MLAPAESVRLGPVPSRPVPTGRASRAEPAARPAPGPPAWGTRPGRASPAAAPPAAAPPRRSSAGDLGERADGAGAALPRPGERDDGHLVHAEVGDLLQPCLAFLGGAGQREQ